jgi:hypothetical protein
MRNVLHVDCRERQRKLISTILADVIIQTHSTAASNAVLPMSMSKAKAEIGEEIPSEVLCVEMPDVGSPFDAFSLLKGRRRKEEPRKGNQSIRTPNVYNLI